MAGRREKLRRVGTIHEYRGVTPDDLASGDGHHEHEGHEGCGCH